jgi:hypothetical protein
MSGEVVSSAHPLLRTGPLAAHRDEYRAARPWPHLVLDDVIDTPTAAAVVREAQAALSAKGFRQDTRRVQKTTISDLAAMGTTTRRLVEEMNDDTLLAEIAALTGVQGLVIDATLHDAGLFVTPSGGWQRVHEDFGVHPMTGLYHRAAVLLYCSQWEPGWGGELELWPRDMAHVGRRVEPRPGRLVLFETSASTRHGLRAMSYPPDMPGRVALSVRLFSAEPPAVKPSGPFRSWSRRPGERWVDILPEGSELVRGVTRRLKRRRPGA